MKKKIVLAATLAGMALVSACGKNDSYKAKVPSDTSGSAALVEKDGESENSTVEQKAIELLNADSAFSSRDLLLSGLNEKNIVAVQAQVLSQASAVSLSKIEVSIFDQKSTNCLPSKNETTQFSAQDSLIKGLSVKNTGRIQCVEDDCNHLLLIVERDYKEGSFPNGMKGKASSAILLEKDKDEASTYHVMTTESDLFAKVSGDMTLTVQTCLQEGFSSLISSLPTMEDVKSAYSDAVRTREDQRLAEIDSEISDLNSQYSKLWFYESTAKMENRERVKNLNEEKATIVNARTKAAYKEYGSSRAASDTEAAQAKKEFQPVSGRPQ